MGTSGGMRRPTRRAGAAGGGDPDRGDGDRTGGPGPSRAGAAAGEAADVTRRRTAVGALLLGVGMMNVAYTMLIPIVPELTERFSLSALGIAAAFSGFALAKAFAQPVGGALVDRVPNVAGFASASLFAAAVAIAGLAFSTSGAQVLGWRLAWGVAEGIAMPALYRLASVLGTTTGVSTTRVMGWFGAAAVTGMATGPAIAGLLHVVVGFTGVFLVGAGLTALSGGLLLSLRAAAAAEAKVEAEEAEVAKAEAAKAEAAAPAPAGVGSDGARGATAARSGATALAWLVVLFGMIDLVNNAVYAALEPAVPLHLGASAAGDAVRATAVLFAAGLVVFAVVSAICARFLERQPVLAVSAAGFTVAAVALAGGGLVDGLFAFYAAFLVFMATQPVLYVVARRGISLLPRERLGRAYGAFGVLSDVGFVAGPLLGGFLYERIGQSTFVVLGALAAAAAAGSFATRRLPSRLLDRVEQAAAPPGDGVRRPAPPVAVETGS